MADEKKDGVEQALEEAKAEEKVRGPQETEVRELTDDEQEAVAAWYEETPVRDPSDQTTFARSDQHPSFAVPTGGVDMSAVVAEEPVEEPEATASKAAAKK